MPHNHMPSDDSRPEVFVIVAPRQLLWIIPLMRYNRSICMKGAIVMKKAITTRANKGRAAMK